MADNSRTSRSHPLTGGQRRTAQAAAANYRAREGPATMGTNHTDIRSSSLDSLESRQFRELTEQANDEMERELGERLQLTTWETPPRMTWQDVAALIINKMVGSGILTGPPSVLLYTGNKNIAMILWMGGFLYTLVSMTVFLEFARKMPHTGGELIYLAETFKKPALFAYTLYGIYFVFFNLTTSNCLQFGRQVILAATGTAEVEDLRLVRVFAVVIMLVISLLLFFSMATGRRLNRLFAYLKLGLLLSIFIAGARKAGQVNARDFSTTKGQPNRGVLAALFLVLFSFQGWENATLVAGEIPNNDTLRLGFQVAVWSVGVLYLLINLVYFAAVPWQSDGSVKSQYAPDFFFGDRSVQAFQVLTALSAVGSMLSVSYTSVRVKHTIAWTNIMPWSPSWRRSAPLREKGHEMEADQELTTFRAETPLDPAADSNSQNQRPEIKARRVGAPEGAILLHFIMTSAAVFYSYRIEPIANAIPFTGNIQTYAHAVAAVFLGLRFHRLFYNKTHAKYIPESAPQPNWEAGKPPSWLAGRKASRLLGYLSAVLNLLIVILPFSLLGSNHSKDTRTIPGWWYSVIVSGLALLSTIYFYAFLVDGRWSLSRWAGVYSKIYHHGVDDKNDEVHWCKSCQTNWGTGHRHPWNGYKEYLHFSHKPTHPETPNAGPAGGSGSREIPRPSAVANFLYWLFGGTNSEYYPDFHIDELKEALYSIPSAILGVFRPRRRI